MQLRTVHDEDHDWLVELHNDPIVLRNLTNPTPVTMEQHLLWWKTIENNSREQRFIFETNSYDGKLGTRVGFAKFYSIDKKNLNCSLGGDIHKDFRGQGLAKHMWKTMLDHAFYGSELGLQRVGLTTAEFNDIGQRVYKGLGFKEEGRLIKSLMRESVLYDQICMYMMREDWFA